MRGGHRGVRRPRLPVRGRQARQLVSCSAPGAVSSRSTSTPPSTSSPDATPRACTPRRPPAHLPNLTGVGQDVRGARVARARPARHRRPRRVRRRPRPRRPGRVRRVGSQHDVRSEAGREPRRVSGVGRRSRGARRDRRGRRPRRAQAGAARRTPATARRWRWPTARSARCRRRPRPRPASGSAQARGAVKQALAARSVELEAERDERVLVEETVDVTLPSTASRVGRPAPAHHALRAHRRHLRRRWAGRSPRGPRSRPSGSTSTRSTSAPDHPARTMQDTFFVEPPDRRRRAAHPHLAGAGAHDARRASSPIYVVCPGPGLPHRRARRHPHPGVPPGRGARGRRGHHDGAPARARSTTSPRPMFGDGHRRPACARRTSRSPSRRAEVDLSGSSAGESATEACRTCRGEGWIEWGGCGMVNPQVLRACGIDPERLLRLRVRHGHRAHPACSATASPTCATWSRATCASPRRSEWRSDARPTVAGCASTSSRARRT